MKGAYEPLKVVKELETYIVCWRSPSQSKFIAKYLPYKEKILCYLKLNRDCMWHKNYSGGISVVFVLNYAYCWAMTPFKVHHSEGLCRSTGWCIPNWILIQQMLHYISTGMTCIEISKICDLILENRPNCHIWYFEKYRF